MPPDAPVAVAHGDDLARARHHGVGVEAVLQGAKEGTIRALAFEPPAGGLVEEQYGAAVVVVLAATVGQKGLDGQRRDGPLAHAGAGVVGEDQCRHFGPPFMAEGPLLPRGWLRG